MKHMKYSLLIKAIPLLLCLSSCHQGTQERSGPAAGEESYLSDEAGDIVISREQFESMGMEIGDPAPMLFSNSVSANGYIIASACGSAKISTLISGRVRHIKYSAGDYVRSGAILFSLESREFIELQQIYAETFQRFLMLKADYERMKILNEEKVAAQKDFLKAESEYRTENVVVEGLRARLKMLHVDPSIIEKGDIVPFLSVKSPISGTIIRQELVLGQHVEPDETSMELVDESDLRLRLELFEKSIIELQVGQLVKFALPDRPEITYTATLSHIGKSVSPETRTVECYAEIAKEDRPAFIDNMFVESAILTCEREVLAIPDEALIREPDRDFVLILIQEEDEMIFRKVPVQTGVSQKGYTEILDDSLSSILLVGTFNLWAEE